MLSGLSEAITAEHARRYLQGSTELAYAVESKAKESKAKESKAKESKAKESKANAAVSGAEACRIVLARTLLGTAATIVLDEPTTGLDKTSRERVWEEILKLVDEKTVIIITHDQAAPFAVGDIELSA